MAKAVSLKERADPSQGWSEGACVCGAVRVAIGLPARWAWHDHSAASRHAHGAPYATYVGSWRSRFRILAGEDCVTRYADEAAGTLRAFCARCGAPLFYERARSKQMVNVSRALFAGRTGREPRYHMNLDQAADWLWRGEPLAPLKGYPGVMWERPRKRKRPLGDPMF